MEILDELEVDTTIKFRTAIFDKLEWVIMVIGGLGVLVVGWVLIEELSYGRLGWMSLFVLLLAISPTLFTYLWRQSSIKVEQGISPPIALRKTSIIFFWGLSWVVFLPCILFFIITGGILIITTVMNGSSILDLDILVVIPMVLILGIHVYYFTLTSRATGNAQQLYKKTK